MPLSSSQNPFLKEVRRAAGQGCAMANGCVVAEGPRLVSEALQGRWKVRQILATPEFAERFPELLSRVEARQEIETVEVARRAFRTIAATEQSQGILALVEPCRWEWSDVIKDGKPLVVLDGVQDPGNAGSIVRSTEAFGGAGVVFAEGSVRVANGKFLRAAAGSIFRVPFLEGIGFQELIQEMRRARIELYALVADQRSRGAQMPSLANGGSIAFIVGSEGNGVRAEFLAEARTLSIPTETVESLNAAVACSIALFEAARQRISICPAK